MRRLTIPFSLCVALIAPFLLAPAVAADQDTDEGSNTEIVVIAPRPITTEVSGRGADGRPTAVISLKMVVQYGDLDLRDERNVDLLMGRIRSVARDACKYLDRQYPLNPDPGCQDRAFDDAMKQADAAVAAAHE